MLSQDLADSEWNLNPNEITSAFRVAKFLKLTSLYICKSNHSNEGKFGSKEL